MRDVEIEQIRTANPFPDELPAAPFEVILQRIERETAAPYNARGRARMPNVGGLFTAVLVLVSVAIAVVALGALGHHAHHNPAVKPSATNPPVVQRVIAAYAIFRRPQTAADGALLPRELPLGRAVLLRHLTTIDGHAVFVALTMYHSRLTGWVITKQGRGAHKGAGAGDFAPFPLRKDLPPMVIVGRRWVSFVPDSVTRVVWKSYGGEVVTTHPHDNVVYGPAVYGATFYAGSRQLIEEMVPVAEFRLTAPRGTSSATGEASISMTTGLGTQVDISAHNVLRYRRTYGAWLYDAPGHEHFLGSSIGTAIWPHHTLYGWASLPKNYRSYRELLITVQASRKPAVPGEVVLKGDIPH